MSEQMILNQHLYRVLRHSRLSAFQQFVQQSLDGYFIKVGAQLLGWLVGCFLEVGGPVTCLPLACCCVLAPGYLDRSLLGTPGN